MHTQIDWFNFSHGTFLYRVAFGRNLYNYSFPMHNHTGQWEIIYCYEGKFHHSINGHSHVLAAGDATLVRAEDIHTLKGDGFSFVNIPFDESLIPRLFSMIEIADWQEIIAREFVPVHLDSRQRKKFEEEIDILFEGDSLQLRLRFISFLTWFVSDCLIPRIDWLHQMDIDGAVLFTSSGSSDRWLVKLLSWVDSKRDNIPSVQEVVEQSGYSQEHLSRSFSAYMRSHNRNITLLGYLKEKRIQKAGKLLRDTNLRISIVAGNCGYSNDSLFHRDFKKMYATTPLKYRKQHGIFR